ncbi:dihydrouridine synthase-domain-containing protein [Myxozyma melibiosi]|uniref:tRNA-dihydrouridine(16/17) synthase [NAD(P)(+)] n=1 Tax=Myxozyma melibiosi TaxID=54550 RepID=A0ABR1FBG4_9ASCO
MTKLSGRAFYESLGSPKKIIAPMVDQSELGWRLLSRAHGADLCYTPMLHARLFAESEKYRDQNFLAGHDGNKETDRPLVVQFCANDPEVLLQAAKLVEDQCDAVDLNLGCPQNIAKRGKYGSFLQEDWDLIYKLINILHVNLKIPVTAKIRIFPDKEKTLKYAKMVLSAGAQILTVHGRTREMKGQQTGLADWQMIRFLRDNLPPETVIFANGNILYHEDISRCLEITGADGVMAAEGSLYNPAIFQKEVTYSESIPDSKELIDELYPRVDVLLREYYEILKSTPGEATRLAAKSHFFRLLRPFLPIYTDVRQEIAKINRNTTIEDYEKITISVEEIVRGLLADEENQKKDTIVRSSQPMDESGAVYKDIPFWRVQPYFRPVSGQILYGGKRKSDPAAAESGNKPAEKKERLETVEVPVALSA